MPKKKPTLLPSVLKTGIKEKKPAKASDKAKHEHAAFKKQNERTAFINRLAGELNDTMRVFGGRMKPPSFYEYLLKLFRKEPDNNRWLMLRLLKNEDLHADYRMGIIGGATISFDASADQLTVLLKEPWRDRGKRDYPTDNYWFELLLMTWDRSDNPPVLAKQLTDYIKVYPKQIPAPEFEFVFQIPAGAIHWMVCLRMLQNYRGELRDELVMQGVKFIEMGSFDEADRTILEERFKAEQASQYARRKQPLMEEVRVKAKGS